MGSKVAGVRVLQILKRICGLSNKRTCYLRILYHLVGLVPSEQSNLNGAPRVNFHAPSARRDSAPSTLRQGDQTSASGLQLFAEIGFGCVVSPNLWVRIPKATLPVFWVQSQNSLGRVRQTQSGSAVEEAP